MNILRCAQACTSATSSIRILSGRRRVNPGVQMAHPDLCCARTRQVAAGRRKDNCGCARSYQEFPHCRRSRPQPSKQAARPYVYASPALGVIARFCRVRRARLGVALPLGGRAGSLMTSSGGRWCLLWPIAWPGAEVGLWIPRSSTSRSVTRRLRENARRAAVLHGLKIEVGQVCSRPDQAVPAPGARAASRRAVHSLPLRPSLWRRALLAL